MGTIDLRPRLGRWLPGKRGNRFLFVCFYDPAGIMTVYQDIALWQQYSSHNIEVLNLFPSRDRVLSLPATIDLRDYDGVVIHCTASYHPDNLATLDRNLVVPFDKYDGVKVLMKQDEQVSTNRFAEYIRNKRIDLVLSCLPPEEREKVYPREVVGDVRFLHVLTGYVTPFMQELPSPPLAQRPRDISYRGSLQPLWFGRLGFEKRKIGYDVARALLGHRLTADISSRPSDRLSGPAWFEFLAGSRAVLGVESGANLFDFTGEVESWCVDFANRHPDDDQWGEEFYSRAHRAFLYRFEGNVNYAQISPRHFEAAATRSLQILYDGNYSGIFVPHRHFVPLRRDLSNLPEVLDLVRDDRRASDMVACSYEEIVRNPALHYRAFVQRVDEAIAALLRDKGSRCRGQAAVPRQAQPRALVLTAQDPVKDPRIGWMADGLSADFEVCELFARADPLDPSPPRIERAGDRRLRVEVTRYRHDWPAIPALATMSEPRSFVLHHLSLLHVLCELPPVLLAQSVGALDVTERELVDFRWFMWHLIHTSHAFIEAGRLLGDFDVVVAEDFDALPAAAVLAQEYGARLVYDAHEFWPYSFHDFRHWQIEFWAGFERNLARCADLRVAVSPQLAELMSKEYDCQFIPVPNCAANNSIGDVDIDGAVERLESRTEAHFIFLGGFAAGRGIDDLIAAWQYVTSGARLLLQGPACPFRTQMMEFADDLGLLDNGVSFPQAADPGDLVAAARRADVGIIPYPPNSVNHRYCCPNKLSQYMAAGLPLLCNDTEFVKQVVLDNELGVVVDFSDHRALARAVDELATNSERIAELSHRSRRFFETGFNWELVSRPIYAALRDWIAQHPPKERPELDLSWVDRQDMRIWIEELKEPAAAAAAASESQQLQALRTEMMRLSGLLPQEMERLHNESRRMHQLYTQEIEQLKADSAERDKQYIREIARLNRVIARMPRLAAAAHDRRGMLRRIAANAALRSAARVMLNCLPTSMGARLKANIIMLAKL